MRETTIFTARDGKIFKEKYDCLIYDYKNCTKENEAFVVSSGFYGQYRIILKTYEETLLFQKKAKEQNLLIDRIDLGKYSLNKI